MSGGVAGQRILVAVVTAVRHTWHRRFVARGRRASGIDSARAIEVARHGHFYGTLLAKIYRSQVMSMTNMPLPLIFLRMA